MEKPDLNQLISSIWFWYDLTCIVVHCPDLIDVENATRDSNETYYDKRIIYSCLPGYQFPDKDKQKVVRCTENETWTDFPPPCEGSSSSIYWASYLIWIRFLFCKLFACIVTCTCTVKGLCGPCVTNRRCWNLFAGLDKASIPRRRRRHGHRYRLRLARHVYTSLRPIRANSSRGSSPGSPCRFLGVCRCRCRCRGMPA